MGRYWKDTQQKCFAKIQPDNFKQIQYIDYRRDLVRILCTVQLGSFEGPWHLSNTELFNPTIVRVRLTFYLKYCLKSTKRREKSLRLVYVSNVDYFISLSQARTQLTVFGRLYITAKMCTEGKKTNHV